MHDFHRTPGSEFLETRCMLDASAELVFDFDRSPTDSDSAILGGVAYFAASDLEGDVELWKSDGTAGGTVQVKDVRIGRGSSMPSSITAADGRVYFTAFNDDTGRELWVSDGTEAGTVRLTDLDEGPEDSFSRGQRLTVLGNRVFFQQSGSFWASDGTTEGTHKLVDYRPTEITAGTDRLYFLREGTDGWELWSSDGSVEGTARVLDVEPIRVSGLQFLDGDLYVGGQTNNARPSVWRVDPVTGSSDLVLDSGELGKFRSILRMEDRLVFQVRNGASELSLYSIDATDSQAARILKMEEPSDLQRSVVVGDRMYFVVRTQTGEESFWVTDGTEDGTEQLPFGTIFDLTESDGQFYFTTSSDDGFALHNITDAVEQSFVISASENPQDNVGLLAGLDGSVLFWRPGAGLWSSDGTPEGTQSLMEQIQGPTENTFAAGFVEVNGGFIFTSIGPDRERFVWRSDGTPEGTWQIEHSLMDVQLPETVFNGRAYFQTADGIWSIDAVDNAFVQLPLGVGVPQPTVTGNLVSTESYLYFRTSSEVGFQIWQSDGSAEGTMPIYELPQAFSRFNVWDLRGVGLLDTGGELYAIGSSGEFELLMEHGSGRVSVHPVGDQLAIMLNSKVVLSDGTVDGTVEVPDATFSFGRVAYIGDRMYWIDDQQTFWSTDGTVAGTHALERPADSSPMTILGATDDALIFGGVFGGVFRTDGTVAGTERLSEVNSSPNVDVLAVDGIVYFTNHRLEIWQSDGTPEGTRPINDIAPGAATSRPNNLVERNGYLYFMADDGFHGSEMWRQAIAPQPGDADGNGVVEFADFLAMSANFGRETDAIFSDGDFNGDGTVDFDDFLELSGNFGSRYSDDVG